jgi:hypothetical protein
MLIDLEVSNRTHFYPYPLLNWFRIHLHQIEKAIPKLHVRYLSPSSSFSPRRNGGHFSFLERVPTNGQTQQSIEFVPDGVFSITDEERQKSLLFFIEIDMGTESLAGPKRDPRDVRQEIINYQTYFRIGRYKRYEEIWECKLNGFRLLFLTHAGNRLAALCGLVQEMPPSDFIWLTDQERMVKHGLSANIWARGGRIEAPLQSILGEEMACDAPVLLIKS